MSSRLKFVALVLAMAAIGLAIVLIANRVDTLAAQLEESRADGVALEADLNEQEAASSALAQQVRRLGGKPVVDPPKVDPLPGPAGSAGRDGPRGRPGEDGKDGRPGADGEDGTDGTNGTDGEDGADGQPGPMGATGADGKDGANGADGADGTDGKDGRSVESVQCDNGLGTFTFTYSDGTSQTVQCTPGAGE